MPCLITQSCLILCDPMDSSPPGSSVHGDSPGKNTGVGCHALLQGDLPNPGIQPRSPAMHVDSLPSEPPGKPKRAEIKSCRGTGVLIARGMAPRRQRGHLYDSQ